MLAQCGELVDACKHFYAGGRLSSWKALYRLTSFSSYKIAWGDPRWKRLKRPFDAATAQDCQRVYGNLRCGRVRLLGPNA